MKFALVNAFQRQFGIGDGGNGQAVSRQFVLQRRAIGQILIRIGVVMLKNVNAWSPSL